MRAARATGVMALCFTFGACAYHNVIHNASRLFEAGEDHRVAGRDSLAVALFEDVVRKTGTAYRARPESDWARDALVLLGRSHQRLGDLRAARAAFEEAAELRGDPSTRGDVGVYLAHVSAEIGDVSGALRCVNQAFGAPLSRTARAEAHLLRGRLLLARSLVGPAWWDLDQATAIDGRVRLPAALAALRWGIRHEDFDRSRSALERLMSYPEADIRADSIVTLARQAKSRWSPAAVADLLEGVDRARWSREARGGVALYRAQLLRESGDTTGARLQAARVAAGLGGSAADARLLLADWRLRRASDLQEVYDVRAILLPSGSEPEVASVLAAISELEERAEAGLDEPLGWFAAAEIARDRLGADYVARGLMLAYADAAPQEPWAAKALLAALAVSPSAGDRAWLRGRLEAHRDSPYVVAALGGSAVGFEDLEEELEVRLGELSRQ